MSQQQPYTVENQYALGGAPTPPRDPRGAGRPVGSVPMTPADEITWSTLGHLSWIAGSFVGLPLLGPLVTYLVLRDRGPFVRHHNAEALNFQLSLALYALVGGVAGGVLTLVTLGLTAPLLGLGLLAVAVAGIVFSVLAAIAASRGEWYRYPLTIRFVR